MHSRTYNAINASIFPNIAVTQALSLHVTIPNMDGIKVCIRVASRISVRLKLETTALHTLEAFDAIKLCEELIDDAVGDAGAVVAALWCDGIKLVKEQHAWRRCARTPAT